jgi:hypothetical protein
MGDCKLACYSTQRSAAYGLLLHDVVQNSATCQVNLKSHRTEVMIIAEHRNSV